MEATKTVAHTPGPWYEMTKGDNRYQSEVAQEATGKTIAVTYTSNDADARLIAAAPELLEACRKITRLGDWTGPTPDGFTEAWEAACHAIAKASS